ncbi:MAG: transcription termination factor Rho [Chthoniobacteraceae bacterium]
MSEQNDTPSLFPDEVTKPIRRKAAAKPRATKAVKVPKATKKAEEKTEPKKPAKTAKTTKAAGKTTKTTTAKKPATRTRKTSKKAEAEELALPVAEPKAAKAKPVAAPELPMAPVAPEPPVVRVAPVAPKAPTAPIAPVAPAPEPAPLPVAAEAAPAPRSEQERSDSGDRRGRRNDRDRGNRRGRHNRGRDRDREPANQPAYPQAPVYAGAPVEEWSPRTAQQGAPAQPPARQQPAARQKPEELIIPRRRQPLQPTQPAQPVQTEQPGLSREERIAAARQQFLTSEQPIQQPQAIEIPREPAIEIPRPEPVYAEGLVEVSGKGFGFLRDPKRGYSQHPSDVFVTPEVCRRYALRDGTWIKGEIRRGNRGPQLYRLTEIEGEDPETIHNVPMFDELTTVNPNHFIKLETTPERNTTRVIDLMAPIGRGQRGLIVAPPRTGKTTYLQHIAEAVVKNHPEMKLIILLVDERPEEVTDIKRSFPQAEIMASSNDQEIKSHTRIAQLAIERARRLVELGKHVFVLLDSITRVGRAFNNSMGGGGRTMSGGVDARALEIPRKLFAAARNTEEAGSLTIVATALVETGSRMDDLIFQEFKGTGNMELVLDRKISDMRIYPAVDIFMSGTRREELLLPEADLHKINTIRRGLSGHKPPEAIERLLFFLNKFPTNAQMLREIPG